MNREFSWKAARLGAIVAVCAAVGACSSVKSMFGDSDTPPPAAAGASGTTAAGSEPAPNALDTPCPDITVRNGAATLTIGKTQKDGDVAAMDLRYQGTIVNLARDCHPQANKTMTMKIGIEGRIITGPAGGPGNVDVPLRIAVVEEGPSPKVVLSKLVVIPVTVTSDNSVSFTHIDNDISFPMPPSMSALARYVVYVGFDPTAAQHRPRPAPRRKR
jgi:hypothetical protein